MLSARNHSLIRKFCAALFLTAMMASPVLAETCHHTVDGSPAPICGSRDEMPVMAPAVVPKFNACYQYYSECVPQADGKCGWTPSAELDDCIDSPEKLKETEKLYHDKMRAAQPPRKNVSER